MDRQERPRAEFSTHAWLYHKHTKARVRAGGWLSGQNRFISQHPGGGSTCDSSSDAPSHTVGVTYLCTDTQCQEGGKGWVGNKERIGRPMWSVKLVLPVLEMTEAGGW